MHRAKIIQAISDALLSLPCHRTLRVAIDGDAGAGKTTLGDELRSALLSSGRPIIRASVDLFHNPRDVRYRLGRDSAEGFLFDSYDYTSLRRLLLDPLSPGGTGHFCRSAFNHRSDSQSIADEEYAEAGSILILDGLFLLRRELLDCWDYSIFLEVSSATGLRRCALRGDGSPDPLAPSNHRYVEGWRLYLSRYAPAKSASLVLDNEDLENLKIKKEK